jgi:predicted phosphodiesterase
MTKQSKLWVFAPDIHYPEHNKPTLNALHSFVRQNEIEGFIFGGDQFSNNEISHWNKKKPIFKSPGLYKRNSDGFDRDVLTPLEKALRSARKVWIKGNHERFEQDLLDAQPELAGTIEHEKLLRLVERGWEVIELGKGFKVGKHLLTIHGENLTGIGNQAGAFPTKKAVESYAKSVLFGHIHTLQSYTKVLPHDVTQKWAAYSSPCIANANPGYARNKPNAVVNGFSFVELNGDLFNVFPIVVTKGMFSYGGKIYGGN